MKLRYSSYEDAKLYILQHILLGLGLLQNIHGATISLFGGF